MSKATLAQFTRQLFRHEILHRSLRAKKFGNHSVSTTSEHLKVLPLDTGFGEKMSKPHGGVVEGVFAINKPASISSAQVIRNLQRVFNPSTLFAPWLQHERAIRERESHYQRKRRKDKRIQVKVGHGGTLDPMATGVLIMGVGKGTKCLQGFLECTKSYEATVLFGLATDTYDTLGKVLRRAPYEHITREMTEKALQSFRGRIMQRPPIYSALRIDGKRLYEYAREGRDLPREIRERLVEVKELEIVEWFEKGTYVFSSSKEEMEPDLKEATLGSPPDDVSIHREGRIATGVKRKRSIEDSGDSTITTDQASQAPHNPDRGTIISGGLNDLQSGPPLNISPKAEVSDPAPGSRSQTPHRPQQGPPAVKLRMTVKSGFYVRSLAHDLGEAVGSSACMSALVRIRQGNFILGRNVMEYEDIDKGEAVWGPKLQGLMAAKEDYEVLEPDVSQRVKEAPE
ncbi:MAG: hypothetical protein Q9163_003555 [Psora crenata]